MFKKVILILTTICIISCNSMPGMISLTDEARNANFRIVTVPQAVEGMTFVDGNTGTWGYGYTVQEIGIITANQLAKNGYKNLTIFIELLNQGYGGGPAAVNVPSRQHLVRITLWE